MKRKTRLIALVALLMAAVLVLSSCAADAAVTGKKKKNTTPTPAVTAVPEATEEPGPIIEPQRIAASCRRTSSRSRRQEIWAGTAATTT